MKLSPMKWSPRAADAMPSELCGRPSAERATTAKLVGTAVGAKMAKAADDATTSRIRPRIGAAYSVAAAEKRGQITRRKTVAAT